VIVKLTDLKAPRARAEAATGSTIGANLRREQFHPDLLASKVAFRHGPPCSLCPKGAFTNIRQIGRCCITSAFIGTGKIEIAGLAHENSCSRPPPRSDAIVIHQHYANGTIQVGPRDITANDRPVEAIARGSKRIIPKLQTQASGDLDGSRFRRDEQS
jgi:hypothetical protein